MGINGLAPYIRLLWQDLGLEAVGIVSCAGEAMSPRKARRE